MRRCLAEYLAFAEVVPFEQSKLSVSALASLVMRSIPPGLGNIGVASVPAILTGHGPGSEADRG
jgi:hypothetical protein